MDEKCYRRSRSVCSRRSTGSRRAHIAENGASHRCTCVKPPSNYRCPDGRAIVQPAQAVRHPSLLSQPTFGHHNPPHLPRSFYLPPSQSNNNYRHHQFSERNFVRYNHHTFPKRPQRNGATFTPPRAASPCHSEYCGPRFGHTQVFGGYNDENYGVERVYHLRSYEKRSSELFVAEYCHVEHLHRYPSLFAKWILPSHYPFYSVVFMRSMTQSLINCSSFRNLCETTIGGSVGQKGSGKLYSNRSIYDFMGRSHKRFPSDATKNYDGSRKVKNFVDLKVPSDQRSKLDKGEDDAFPSIPSLYPCSSFSESITVEKGTFGKQNAERTHRGCFGSTQPQNDPQKNDRKRKCRRCTIDRLNDSNMKANKDDTKKRSCSGKQALEILQRLEGHFGLKSNTINCAQSAQPDNFTTTNSFSYKTASLICPCHECCASISCLVQDRSHPNTTNAEENEQLNAATELRPTASGQSMKDGHSMCGSNKIPSMVSVPNNQGSTAHEMICPPPDAFSDGYCTAPNYSPNYTISGPREDSRSGGRDYRRSSSRRLCENIPQYSISDLTMTALPLYDPQCNQCAEARFGDRLYETLNKDCSCTPVIRTDPTGRISFINNPLYTPVSKYKDTVMDEKNKKSLARHLKTKSKTDGSTTLKDAIMQWVKRKSAICKTKMNNLWKPP